MGNQTSSTQGSSSSSKNTKSRQNGNRSAKVKEKHKAPQKEDKDVYILKKRRPGCTGLFWRQDPTSSDMLASGDDWPRDGARLIGIRVGDKFGDEWLRTTHVRNPKEENGGRRDPRPAVPSSDVVYEYGKWRSAPVGSAIPMEDEDNNYHLELLPKDAK